MSLILHYFTIHSITSVHIVELPNVIVRRYFKYIHGGHCKLRARWFAKRGGKVGRKVMGDLDINQKYEK